MVEDKGQPGGTPAADKSTTGQEKVAASPGSETDQILAAVAADEKAEAAKAADKTAEKAAGKEDGKKSGEGDDDSKPLPYDQDPKWKAARAAQAKMEDILEKHGLDSFEELDDLIAGGSSISEILGARDAKTITDKTKQLIKDAEYLKEVKAYWAEQEAQKQKDELTPEERAEMSEKQLKEYKQAQADKEAKAAEDQSIKQALESYTGQADKAIEVSGLEGEDAAMAKLFLGVDNPFNEVDITDKKAVKEMAKVNTAKFKTYLDSVRQSAVDEYAKGKSKFVPISTVATPAKEAVKPKELPPGSTIEEGFAQANAIMMEFVKSMESA